MTKLSDGAFFVASFFSILRDVSPSLAPFGNVWKSKAPPRVSAFAWLAISGAILKMDNLHKHNITIVNGCLMCLHDAETVDHLLLHCEVAQFLWNSILSWFDCSWVSHIQWELSITLGCWGLVPLKEG